MNRTSVIGMLAAATAVLTLAGCTSSERPAAGAPVVVTSAPAADQHNSVDVTFAQGMVPHHQQAVDMATLVSTRAAGAQVKQLASRIEQAQGPEIEQLQGFLKSWGAPASGMGHDMAGMQPDQQLTELRQATGTAFDRLFLQLMVEHHTGAVQMAQTELAAGQSAEAKALAKAIVTAQQAEITEMNGLLAG